MGLSHDRGEAANRLKSGECLFYRVTINVEAPLNVVLFKVVMRRMKVWEIIGVSLRVEALLVFFDLDIKYLWVKKCKNFTERHCRLACVRFRDVRFSADETDQRSQSWVGPDLARSRIGNPDIVYDLVAM